MTGVFGVGAAQKIAKKHCGECSLCCKLLKINAFDKPKSVWCNHCSPSNGCKMYSGRPEECKVFYCGYLTVEGLGDEWRPSYAKIVLVAELEGNRITAYVDPHRPDAWKREPYYSTLKNWAERGAQDRGQVMVCVGERMFMIFPDRDEDLGIVTDDDLIITGEKPTPFGVQLIAFKIHKDDPQLENIKNAPGSRIL